MQYVIRGSSFPTCRTERRIIVSACSDLEKMKSTERAEKVAVGVGTYRRVRARTDGRHTPKRKTPRREGGSIDRNLTGVPSES